MWQESPRDARGLRHYVVILPRALPGSDESMVPQGEPCSAARAARGLRSCAVSQVFGSALASSSWPGRAPRPKRLTAMKAATEAATILPGETLPRFGRQLRDGIEDRLAQSRLHVVAALAHLGEGRLRRLGIELRRAHQRFHLLALVVHRNRELRQLRAVGAQRLDHGVAVGAVQI